MPRTVDILTLAARPRNLIELKGKLEEKLPTNWRVRWEQVVGAFAELGDDVIGRNNCIRRPSSSEPTYGAAGFRTQFGGQLFCSEWRGFDVMHAIEVAFRLKAKWDDKALISSVTGSQCGLAIGIHIQQLTVEDGTTIDQVTEELGTNSPVFPFLVEADRQCGGSDSLIVVSDSCAEHTDSQWAIFHSGFYGTDVGPKFCRIHGFADGETMGVASGLSFVRDGLAEIRTDGLCRQQYNPTQLELGDLKRWIGRCGNRIRILQTHIPDMALLRRELFDALKGGVRIEVLLLNPQWTIGRLETLLAGDAAVTTSSKTVTSLFARQRGFELGDTPFNITSDIPECVNELRKLGKDYARLQKAGPGGLEVRLYDTLPSVLLHCFDDVMFIGFFLKSKLEVATPHFAVVNKGQELFRVFNGEFEALWSDKMTKHVQLS